MGTQTSFLIAILYGVVTVLGVLAALFVARSMRRRSEEEVERYRHNEVAWMGFVIGLLAILLVSTIFLIPYNDEASAGEGAMVVNVRAAQFGWQIQPPRMPAGVPIEFHLTSRDVNHGFGIYDEDDNLKKQVQVAPGKTQELVYTFEEPGTYRILCLEFCGVSHHAMIGTLEVTG